MRKEYSSKPWIMPQPVLIIGTYDKEGNANAMNAAWGGTYDMDKVFIALSEHKTTANLKLNKAFTLSFGTRKTVVACDYVGVVSQKQEPNKIKKAGLTPIKSSKVNAPLFEEFPLTMECEVESFNEEEGILIGKVVSVSVDESYIKDGKIDTERMEFISYDAVNHKYRLVKEEVADAFKVGFTLK